MAGIESAAASVGGVGVGVGSTLAVRRQFDQSGETAVLRPSVLWGLGTGAAALATSHLLLSDMDGVMMEAVEDYGEAALTAGAVSAFVPGGDVAMPTV